VPRAQFVSLSAQRRKGIASMIMVEYQHKMHQRFADDIVHDEP